MEEAGKTDGLGLPDEPMLAEIGTLSIQAESIRRWLGCGRGRAIQGAYEKHIDAVQRFALVNDLIQPMAAIRFLRIAKVASEAAWLSNDTIIHGTFISDHIQSAKSIAIAAAHIGSRLEAAVHALMNEKRFFRAILLEAYGNAALETVTSQVVHHVSVRAKQNRFSASSPYYFGSPGLPLGTHFRFGKFFPYDLIHIAHTQAGGFRPAKSACLIMGIGDSMPTWTAAHMCRTCPNSHNCPYRHEANSPLKK